MLKLVQHALANLDGLGRSTANLEGVLHSSGVPGTANWVEIKYCIAVCDHFVFKRFAVRQVHEASNDKAYFVAVIAHSNAKEFVFATNGGQTRPISARILEHAAAILWLLHGCDNRACDLCLRLHVGVNDHIACALSCLFARHLDLCTILALACELHGVLRTALLGARARANLHKRPVLCYLVDDDGIGRRGNVRASRIARGEGGTLV
mmetsp:Transcript_37495/g.94208  ORF Transcript_37495/g.94208 Transcript_37495/m.94208 type:complete len:208 (-) Transcript_37495:4030-4653(-)